MNSDENRHMDVKKVMLACDYLLSSAERQMDCLQCIEHATLLSALQKGSLTCDLMHFYAFLDYVFLKKTPNSDG